MENAIVMLGILDNYHDFYKRYSGKNKNINNNFKNFNKFKQYFQSKILFDENNYLMNKYRHIFDSNNLNKIDLSNNESFEQKIFNDFF